jgi:outer membrane protein OmpA-like peptidoglycan-associated protein
MRKLICFLLLLSFINSPAQDLLLNGGFEEENTCTEYKIECAPEAWIGSSGSSRDRYVHDPARSHNGEFCMAIEAGHSTRPYHRTFIRSPLLCKMRVGSTYRLKFFVKSPHAVLDSVGVYFGPLDPLLERKPIYRLAPSLFLASNPSNRFRNDSSWQQAVLDYTATGTETFLTIAYFSRNDLNGKTGISRRNEFLFYVDDVSLMPLDPSETLCDNWQKIKQDIYDQNERHQYLDRVLKYRPNPDLHETTMAPPLVAKSDTLLLSDVLFMTGKKNLQPKMAVVLDSFCKSMAGKLIDSLVIEGHTDNTGTSAFNEQLSSGRAQSIADYLSSCAGFSAALFVTRGWASRKPVAPNNTAAGRQKNRRVELVVYFRE